jgi:hypothetical protein
MKSETCAMCVMGTIVRGRCNTCNAVYAVQNAEARKQALLKAGREVRAQQQAQQQATRAENQQSNAKTATSQTAPTKARRCKRCGQAAVLTSKKRCEGCGAFFNVDERAEVQVTCARCESVNPPGAKICYGCGHRIETKR